MREERITRDKAKIVMQKVCAFYSGPVVIPEINWWEVFGRRTTISVKEAIQVVKNAIDEANK